VGRRPGFYDASVRRHHRVLLEAADIGPGDRVLDLGCGTGQSTREAARRAAGGTAPGIDLLLPMIEVARLLLVSWRSAAENEWISTLRQALLPGAPAPEVAANAPGAFRHADRDDIAAILAAAGYGDIHAERLDAPMYFGAPQRAPSRCVAPAVRLDGPRPRPGRGEPGIRPDAADVARPRDGRRSRVRVSGVVDHRPARTGTTRTDGRTIMNQTNEQLFRTFITTFESGDTNSIKDLVDPDITDHTLPPGASPGIEGLLYAVRACRQGFPDLRITVRKVVSDGDCVVGYGRISGTNTGSFFGMPPPARPPSSATSTCTASTAAASPRHGTSRTSPASCGRSLRPQKAPRPDRSGNGARRLPSLRPTRAAARLGRRPTGNILGIKGDHDRRLSPRRVRARGGRRLRVAEQRARSTRRHEPVLAPAGAVCATGVELGTDIAGHGRDPFALAPTGASSKGACDG
jgi:predicted ester cyclase/SAM-dependent methyltransferase